MKSSEIVGQFGKPCSVLIISGETMIYRARIFSIIQKIKILNKLFSRISELVSWLANPKNPSYLIEKAYDWVGSNLGANSVDFLVDNNNLAERIRSFNKSQGMVLVYPKLYFEGILKNGNTFLKNFGIKYDAVVIVYNDCLGLGWCLIDKFVRKYISKNIIIYNGRHRIIFLTKKIQIDLMIHRGIEKYLVIQLLLMPVFFVIFFIASIDHTIRYLSLNTFGQKNE